jgi:hypothetical protein
VLLLERLERLVLRVFQLLQERLEPRWLELLLERLELLQLH